ncbi:MAG TPA: DUF488 family protein [Acidimicrobiales bacterium]|nr:DUF488 family protein [Acidimicrobiales bacterium]
MKLPVEVRRVYDDPKGQKTEYRVLVDRLWPRGISKGGLRLDEWAKDAAPSSELRKWFGHDPELFEEFSRRYRKELRQSAPAGAVKEIVAAAAERSVLVVLTATKDVEHSGATVLAEHLRSVMARRS